MALFLRSLRTDSCRSCSCLSLSLSRSLDDFFIPTHDWIDDWIDDWVDDCMGLGSRQRSFVQSVQLDHSSKLQLGSSVVSREQCLAISAATVSVERAGVSIGVDDEQLVLLSIGA